MYSQALAGTTIQIASCMNREWLIHPNLPAGYENTIFLPLYVDRYDSREENFAWYKVSATHQASHIEFGTFNFSFERVANLFSERHQCPPSTRDASLTDIEVFFSLFDDRKLAEHIFTMVEDIRIDYLVKQEYAGISDVYQQIQLNSLSNRPPIASLSIREAFLEIIMWRTTGCEPRTIPYNYNGLLESSERIIQGVQSPEAHVDDSAKATLYLYDILSSINTHQLPEGKESASDLHFDDTEVIYIDDVPNDEVRKRAITQEDKTGLPYQSFVEAADGISSESKPFSSRDVERHVNKSKDPTEVLRKHYPASGFYTTDLLGSGTLGPEMFSLKQNRDMHMSRITTLAETPEDEVLSFLYDEWNFRTCGYMPRWCRVREIPLRPGNTKFFKETLAHNSQLAMQLRKQFEILAPQELKKLNKLQDGEEFDLDAIIEAVQERKAGHRFDDKVYCKRIRTKRDIAVVFLIDMSASTSDVVKNADEKGKHPRLGTPATGGLPQPILPSSGERHQRPRRVIDIAKESIVLMISALEILRDCYGVYGFSSSGRDNVEFLVIKGIDETFSPTIEGRIDRIRPLFSTRMGPAIRHAASKLEARHEKTKILFLVSDGYPQDRDYGLDSEDKEYASHDTMMAFVEAKQKNIIPFCLTIDATGYDFLNEMSHHIDHQVIRNIESLPQHLPNLYKRLTS